LPFVLGVYNLRGEIIPILDLRLFFNIEVPPRDPNKLENMLILQVEDQKFGVVVDKIDKVIGVQKSTIQPPHPLFGDINIKYINGVVESNKRLYVLLDVTRIFTSKDALETNDNQPYFSQQSTRVKSIAGNGVESAKPSLPNSVGSAVQKAAEVPAAVDQAALKFVKESLFNYKKFTVSSVNDGWIARRYNEWSKLKGANAQIQNEKDAEEFLKPFWSVCTDAWWTKDYADSVYKLLPDNSAKQLIVWNPGCGKGLETYSLACILQKRYPNAKIRIYAQDVDLLAVSNATLLSVPASLSNEWYGPYLTKKANGEYTFRQDIKDSIMFEYHDCKNTNALPMVDLIFARDMLSLLDESAQEAVVADFLEKMKGNGVVIIGDNEAMPASFNFAEKTVDTFVAYSKD